MFKPTSSAAPREQHAANMLAEIEPLADCRRASFE
jgi:hypothetical protein